MNLSLSRRLRSFQRGTVGFCWLTGFKITSCQSWRFERNFATWPTANYRWSWSSSKFDRPQLCNPLMNRDSWYLFGKILSSSKPYFHKAYLVTVCGVLTTSVCKYVIHYMNSHENEVGPLLFPKKRNHIKSCWHDILLWNRIHLRYKIQT